MTPYSTGVVRLAQRHFFPVAQNGHVERWPLDHGRVAGDRSVKRCESSHIRPFNRRAGRTASAFRGGTGYKVQFVAFAGESHSNAPPAALGRRVHFAFDQ